MNEEYIKSLYLEEKTKWDEGREQGLVKGEFMPFYVFVQAGGFIGNTEETREDRLNSLSKQFNGGKNSGNHNPGQGRGRGKPEGGGYKTSWKSGNEKSLRNLENLNSSLVNLTLIAENKRNNLLKKGLNDKAQQVLNSAETLVEVYKNCEKEGVDLSEVRFEDGSKCEIPVYRELFSDRSKGLGGQTMAGINGAGEFIHMRVLMSPHYGWGTKYDIYNSYEPDSKKNVSNGLIGGFRHEIGHVASHQISLKERNKICDEDFADSIIKEALGDSNRASKKMSNYGKFAAEEFLAESWANPDYSEDTKKVYDVMISRLKGKQ